MREGMLHIRDVEGPKKTRSVEARLEAMEQQVFKCQGMVEHGLNANHMMITEFTNKDNIDANDIGKHLSRLYDRIDHLQAQIYDLQNQKWDATREDRSVLAPSYCDILDDPILAPTLLLKDRARVERSLAADDLAAIFFFLGMWGWFMRPVARACVTSGLSLVAVRGRRRQRPVSHLSVAGWRGRSER
ncbi:40S ribosomal protein S5-1 [Hordeum vulgare]|nr:40S ribosomal protein S5-1 [Hordeum vulgare]